MQAYDIIGDIHGFADELETMLTKLGYTHDGYCFHHHQRRVIFLGDFIDRGPQQRQVLQLVMAMVKEGSAMAVMGNHEFNALAFHRQYGGQWLRPHTDKNISQHAAFLNAYPGNADSGHRHEGERRDILQWFETLPLWLDLPGLRVIHACWHEHSIERLKAQLNADNTLTPQVLIDASTRGRWQYQLLETLLKGLEVELPAGQSFLDKDGHRRTAVRTRWWLGGEQRFPDVVLPQDVAARLEDLAVPAGTLPGYDIAEKPVFLGHYWMQGAPQLLAANVACLDYSVAQGGQLVAYRWDGEQALNADKFVVVSARPR